MITDDNIHDLVKRYENQSIIQKYGRIKNWNVSRVTDM